MKPHGTIRRALLVGAFAFGALLLFSMASHATMNGCAPIDFNTAGGIGDTGWVITPNDFLVITGASSQVNERLNINLRFVAEDITFFDQVQLPLLAGDRSVQQVKYDFTPVFAAVFANRSYAKQIFISDISIESVVATTRGQTFARVNLYRFGASINQNVKPIAKCAIMSDYVTTQVTACLRNARHFTSIEGQGWTHVLVVQDPGNQLEWTFTVPANTRVRIKSLFAEFQSDGTAGVRSWIIRIFDPGALGRFIWWVGDTFSGPNIADMLNFTSGVPFAHVAEAAPLSQFIMSTVPLPFDLTLEAGGIVNSSSVFIGISDHWANISIEVEEWLDNV